LRAIELEASSVLKATHVDGIYDSDPSSNPDANKIHDLTYMEFISKELRVMDTTAVTLCKEHGVPIVVFDMTKPGNILAAVRGDEIGTIVH
jgi:uridylate kinase